MYNVSIPISFSPSWLRYFILIRIIGRRRKVRCVWPSEGAEICQNCLTRGQSCEVQTHMVSTHNTVTLTSRARIRQLEGDVSSLWKVVRNLEAKLGCVPTDAPTRQSLSVMENGSSYDKPGDDDSESDASDLSATVPPSHLHQLFDNRLLGSSGHESTAPSPSTTSVHKTHRTTALNRLMPSKEDMIQVAAQAESWLALYSTLFPTAGSPKDGVEMLTQYNQLQGPNADPVEVASLLLTIAITVQPSQESIVEKTGGCIKNPANFIKEVSDSVERIVISDDELAGTLRGIETTLLFLRL